MYATKQAMITKEHEADIDTAPIMCPFCGSEDLKPRHDQPIVI